MTAPERFISTGIALILIGGGMAINSLFERKSFLKQLSLAQSEEAEEVINDSRKELLGASCTYVSAALLGIILVAIGYALKLKGV